MTSAEQDRLDRLKEIFSSIPEGRELLELAESNGCAIVFNPDLPDNETGRLSFKDKSIYLNPCKDDSPLLETLAHELRHLWQHCFIDHRRTGAYSVPYVFAYMRVIEGDAFAFADGFMEKLKSPGTEVDVKKTFTDFQVFLEAYDKKTLELLESIQSEITGGNLDKNTLTNIFNRVSLPPTPDENILRITVSGLAEDSPKYLDFKTVQELTDAVLAHVPPDTLKKAAQLVAGIKKSSGRAAGLTP